MNQVLNAYIRAFADYTATMYSQELRSKFFTLLPVRKRALERATETAATIVLQSMPTECDEATMLLGGLIVAEAGIYEAEKACNQAFILSIEEPLPKNEEAKVIADAALESAMARGRESREALAAFVPSEKHPASAEFLKFVAVIRAAVAVQALEHDLYGILDDQLHEEATALYERACEEFCA